MLLNLSQAIVLNVAINSFSKALLTIMISNQVRFDCLRLKSHSFRTSDDVFLSFPFSWGVNHFQKSVRDRKIFGIFGIFWDFLRFFGIFLGFIKISEMRDFWDFLRFFGIFWDFWDFLRFSGFFEIFGIFWDFWDFLISPSESITIASCVPASCEYF